MDRFYRAKRNRNSKDIAFTCLELLVVLAGVALVVLIAFSAQAQTNPRRMRATCANNLRQIALAFRLWEGDYGSRFPQSYAGEYPQYTFVNGGMQWSRGGSGVPGIYTVFLAMTNELNTPKVLICPADIARIAATNFGAFSGNIQTSYFVGAQAIETAPQMFLTGDRNMCSSTTDPVSENAPIGGYSPGYSSGTAPGYSIKLTTNPPVNLGWNITEHSGVGNVALVDGSVQLLNFATTRQALTQTQDPYAGTNSGNWLLFP